MFLIKHQLRENRPLRETIFDTEDKLAIDRPPRGAHGKLCHTTYEVLHAEDK